MSRDATLASGRRLNQTSTTHHDHHHHRQHKQHKAAGTFERALNSVYEVGRKTQWKLGALPGQVQQGGREG